MNAQTTIKNVRVALSSAGLFLTALCATAVISHSGAAQYHAKHDEAIQMQRRQNLMWANFVIAGLAGTASIKNLLDKELYETDEEA